MKVLLALDQGTTSSRAMVFDDSARVVGVSQREMETTYPRAGWVEQDPRQIWSTQLETARAALGKAGVAPADVAAIGISNQRETTLLWDRNTGEPLYNAIVWQDRRTANACGRLRARDAESIVAERTGLLIDPYFSATKLAWLLDHVDGARARAQSGELAFGTVDAWLIWNLTGGRLHATDATNASRTMLFNIHTCDWDDTLLRLLDIPRSVLPRVIDSSGVCGESDQAVLGASIPIGGIAGDQQAALFGQQCVRNGMVKNTYGTGCFMLMQTGDRPIASGARLLTTVAWKIGERVDYALEGSVFVGGAVVQWLRDGLGLIRSASDVNALAGSVDDNGGVYFVPAFAGLGAPHWDPLARGTVIGLTGGSRAGHLARAAVESIAFQTTDIVQAMRADSGIEVTELRVDGGASQSDLLLQFQADMLGVPVLRPRNYESTALGAASLAGLAVGFWPDVRMLEQHWQLDRRFEPEMPAARADTLKSNWHRAVERARDWARDTDQGVD
jgi:glycerol kinase